MRQGFRIARFFGINIEVGWRSIRVSEIMTPTSDLALVEI